MFAPAEAVLKIADADAMYVVEENTAHLRVVQLGEAQNGMVRVDAGLQEGAMVATNNLDKLSDGAAVRLTDAAGAVARNVGRAR